MPATILLVQTDRSVCDLYRDILDAEGYEIRVAHDGIQALEVVRTEEPDFVVMDIELPRQGGFEVLAEMHDGAGHRSIPVLLQCDDDVLDELEERAREFGAIGVVSSPMDPDQLLARVSEFANNKNVKEEAEDSTAGDVGVHAMPTEGDLKQTPFPGLIHGLHRSRLDGVLLVEHGRKKKAIEFREGWPVCVKSNLVSECLGNYLVRTNRCSREQVDESVERMKTGEGLQGEILVAMDVLDEEGVIRALEDHALEKLFEIFSWRDGIFQVRSNVRIQRGSSIAIEGHPSNLVVQGVRTKTPLKWVDRYLELNADFFLVPRTSGAEGGLETVELTPEEVEWMQGLDGSIALGALKEEPESIRRLVFGLLSVEMFSVEAAAGNPDEACELARSVAGRQQADRTEQADEDGLRAELAQMANQMQTANFFDVLGVSLESGDDEIREAYTRLADQVSEDRFRGASSSVRQLASQVISRIDSAYAAVASEEGRALYSNSISGNHHQIPDAEDEGRRALRAETEFQNGEALLHERDYEGALLCFGRAIENFPGEGEYRSHYGWCLHLCHPDNEVMLAEALEHCRQGVKLAKDREKPYLLLGRLHKAMGKPDAAKKMFTRAVQIKPRCVEAMRELRIMNMRRNKDKGVLKRIFRR